MSRNRHFFVFLKIFLKRELIHIIKKITKKLKIKNDSSSRFRKTTWLSNTKDKIIEFALVKFDENTWEIIETYESLVNPKISIPEVNSTMTWITDEMVKDFQEFEDFIEKIEEFYLRFAYFVTQYLFW